MKTKIFFLFFFAELFMSVSLSLAAEEVWLWPIEGQNTGEGILYRPDAYNKVLKWETTTTYNIGLDFGLFNNRISGSVDLYKRKTTDLINDAPAPAGRPG